RIHERLLLVEERVRQFLHGQAVRAGPRLAASMQVVLLFQVLRQGAVGVVPRAEVMELAADLLRPDACGVGVKREVGVGLLRVGRFAGNGTAARMMFRHGDFSSTWWSLCQADSLAADRPSFPDCTGRRSGRKGRLIWSKGSDRNRIRTRC